MFVRLLILVTLCAYCKGGGLRGNNYVYRRYSHENQAYDDQAYGYGDDRQIYSYNQVAAPEAQKSKSPKLPAPLPEPEYRYDYTSTYSEEANGWLKLHFSPMNWEDARLQCYHEGAVLASPLNEKFVLGLKKLLQLQKMVPTAMFSGVHSLFAPGVYTSVEGVPLEKMTIHWGVDEPKYFSEGSGCLVFSSQGTMASRNCNDRFSFICYKEHSDLVQNECGTSDKEYERVNPETNAETCFKCHSGEEEWSKAFAICQAEGAYLAIINSTLAAELRSWKLRKIGIKNVFIGFKNIGGVWWDIHGNLMKPEPNSSTPHQKCGALSWDGNFESADCDAKYSFICEKTMENLSKKK